MSTAAPPATAPQSARKAGSRDPRAERVRAGLYAAAEQMGQAGEPISVSALVKRAGVSRAAFYVHFADLADFALHLQQQHFDAIARTAELDRTNDARAAMLQAQRQLVAHFAANLDLYRTVLALTGAPGFGAGTAAALERAILQHIERACTPPAGIQPELAANYIAGAATALITSWVLGAVDADEETMAQHLFALMPQWMHSGRPVESRSGEAATRGEPHPELPAATPQRRTEQINS